MCLNLRGVQILPQEILHKKGPICCFEEFCMAYII